MLDISLLIAASILCSIIPFIRADENIHQQIDSLKKVLTVDFDSLFCAHRPVPKNGKERIKAKLDFLENLKGYVLFLHNKGMSEKAITKKFTPKGDTFIRWLTMNNVSFGHMVKSVLYDKP